MLVKPRMIKREALRIAGVSGDGGHTAEVWDAYMRVEDSIPDRRSADGYEVRIERPEGCLCHVGCTVAGKAEGGAYTVMTLPASQYAVFEVYVAEGYESQNATMKEWLETNEEGLRQRKLDGAPYVVEFYDERFAGAESGSIVEIWIPVEKRNQ